MGGSLNLISNLKPFFYMSQKSQLRKTSKELVPAIPPEDYNGTQSDWQVELVSQGLWDGQVPAWYGDLFIAREKWWAILEKCENEV